MFPGKRTSMKTPMERKGTLRNRKAVVLSKVGFVKHVQGDFSQPTINSYYVYQ